MTELITINVDGREFQVKKIVSGSQIKRLAGCDNEYYNTWVYDPSSNLSSLTRTYQPKNEYSFLPDDELIDIELHNVNKFITISYDENPPIKKEKVKTFKLFINQIEYNVESVFWTGLDLKELSDSPKEYGVWQIVDGPEPDKQIDDLETIYLDDNKYSNKFFTGALNSTEG